MRTCQAAGQWVYAGSLTPPESAITVDSAGPVPLEPDVTPGPFSVAAAALGGFWIIEAVNQAAALERATQASAACGQKVELRALEG